MIYLFIHQAFPAQYTHLVAHLVAKGHQVYAIGREGRAQTQLPGVQCQVYPGDPVAGRYAHPWAVEMDIAVRNGAAVSECCRALREQGIHPDLVIGHGGWGETLFVKDIFPDTPLLSYFEFYYHAHGVDLDFDPEFSSTFARAERLRVRNGIAQMVAQASDWGHTATPWQKSLFPKTLRDRISVIHEGVDTRAIAPARGARLELPEQNLSFAQGEEVITYMARSLEPYRGFHVFMRAIPLIQQRRPQARILIVGGDEVSYGIPAAPGSTHREGLLRELEGRIDLSRVHFVPKLSREQYTLALQISAVHVYLTYPFILSWSLIEAMAAGCAIVASNTAPVRDVLRDRVSARLVDFFSQEQLADAIDELLSKPQLRRELRRQARAQAVQNFDLRKHQLPAWRALMRAVQTGEKPAPRYWD